MPEKVLVGTFGDEDALRAAVDGARSRGLAVHDAYTPYPIHGLDEAMGIPRSRLGIVCFGGAATGLLVAFAGMIWISTRSWPINIGGKSFSAVPALVPVAFEVMVLFAALGTVAALFWRARLWPGKKPFLPAPGVTDDRFVLALRVPDERDTTAAREVLQGAAAEDVHELEVKP